MEKELEEKGIIFKDTDSALQENEELFKILCSSSTCSR